MPATPATEPCSRAGASAWCSAASSSPTLRRVPLASLLFVSTLAIGAAYLGTSIAPTLVVACAASVVGGVGNGVQWIALVTAVQEMTSAIYQARVLSLLEAIASAMPGVGLPARWRDRHHLRAPRRLRGRRRGSA